MGRRRKSRTRKQFKAPSPRKRIRWDRTTCLVYLPLTILSFGMVFGVALVHVLNHPDIYHITVFSSIVLFAAYLSYSYWKTQ